MLPQTLESEKTYKAAFLSCDRMLNQVIDCNLSGSTVTMVIFEGNKVITLNAGDSRAIKVSVFKRGEKTHVEATALTIDHKPELSEEKQRILNAGGRIKAFKDNDTNEDIGPQRVWLRNQEMPGLAMSRSLGDKIAHSVGVSSVPEVLEHMLGSDDKFVVIASDGVWEFISNEEVASLVVPFYLEN